MNSDFTFQQLMTEAPYKDYKANPDSNRIGLNGTLDENTTTHDQNVKETFSDAVTAFTGSDPNSLVISSLLKDFLKNGYIDEEYPIYALHINDINPKAALFIHQIIDTQIPSLHFSFSSRNDESGEKAIKDLYKWADIDFTQPYSINFDLFDFLKRTKKDGLPDEAQQMLITSANNYSKWGRSFLPEILRKYDDSFRTEAIKLLAHNSSINQANSNWTFAIILENQLPDDEKYRMVQTALKYQSSTITYRHVYSLAHFVIGNTTAENDNTYKWKLIKLYQSHIYRLDPDKTDKSLALSGLFSVDAKNLSIALEAIYDSTKKSVKHSLNFFLRLKDLSESQYSIYDTLLCSLPQYLAILDSTENKTVTADSRINNYALEVTSSYDSKNGEKTLSRLPEEDNTAELVEIINDLLNHLPQNVTQFLANDEFNKILSHHDKNFDRLYSLSGFLELWKKLRNATNSNKTDANLTESSTNDGNNLLDWQTLSLLGRFAKNKVFQFSYSNIAEYCKYFNEVFNEPTCEYERPGQEKDRVTTPKELSNQELLKDPISLHFQLFNQMINEQEDKGNQDQEYLEEIKTTLDTLMDKLLHIDRTKLKTTKKAL
ncbi:hypothetical protein OZX62_08425 [Bifidobacterium sp. ESL0690]|uniref:hypothetical protein n=1 Tax=Bifidobacterium sp. ESL0690 TaxID=2983214 RepID=UPI0023F986C3|nr:hypothetical protein [Bifidobacterium sp. ESL0690]WEV46448.1 hypothetical protein OZX62_08425 [Bifidobacterium sp. ESL0690]